MFFLKTGRMDCSYLPDGKVLLTVYSLYNLDIFADGFDIYYNNKPLH